MLSGINDIYMNVRYEPTNDLDDLIFYNSEIEENMVKNSITRYSLIRRLVASVISLGRNVELNSIIHTKVFVPK